MTRFRTVHPLPTWRRVALSTWKQSQDPSIYGWLDIDATELLRYLAALREHSGERVTVTHLVGKAAALAFADCPSCNAVAARGGLRQRDSVDVFFSVAIGGGKNLAGAKLRGVDGMPLVGIARALSERVARIRERGDTKLQKSQQLLARMPAWLMGPAMRATAVVGFDLGIDLSRLGVPHDPFGTVIVTNVGTLGIEQGFAPAVPSGRSAAVLTIGKIRDKVIAVDGRPAVRPVLTIGGTFDHRVVDGYHLGRITQRLRAVLEAPVAELGAPGLTGDDRGDDASSTDERFTPAGVGATPGAHGAYA